MTTPTLKQILYRTQRSPLDTPPARFAESQTALELRSGATS